MKVIKSLQQLNKAELTSAINKLPKAYVDFIDSYANRKNITNMRKAKFVTTGTVSDVGIAVIAECFAIAIGEGTPAVKVSKIQAVITSNKLDLESVEFITAIVTKRYLLGFSKDVADKLQDKPKESFKPMLASVPSSNKCYDGVCFIVSEKLDGMRCIAFITKDGAKLFTRAGFEITTVQYINEQLASLYTGTDVMLDGELLSDTGDFSETISAVKRKASKEESNVVYHVFDMLEVTFAEFIAAKRVNVQLKVRVKMLNEFVVPQLSNVKVLATFFASFDELSYYASCYIANGSEGIVAKDENGLYTYKRDASWLKFKDIKSEDLKVIALQEGTGKYTHMLGALICSYKGGTVNVGTGFSDAARIKYWDEDYVGRVAEVHFHEESSQGGLRHPRFIRFRDELQKGIKE